MNYLKKITSSMLIIITCFILLLIITTLLSYLNILKGNGITICNLLIPIISIFIGSFDFGKKSNKNGWLEGLKLGFIITIIFIILNIFIYHSFIIKTLIYYSIFLVSSIFGGSLGISKKKI